MEPTKIRVHRWTYEDGEVWYHVEGKLDDKSIHMHIDRDGYHFYDCPDDERVTCVVTFCKMLLLGEIVLTSGRITDEG